MYKVLNNPTEITCEFVKYVLNSVLDRVIVSFGNALFEKLVDKIFIFDASLINPSFALNNFTSNKSCTEFETSYNIICGTGKILSVL